MALSCWSGLEVARYASRLHNPPPPLSPYPAWLPNGIERIIRENLNDRFSSLCGVAWGNDRWVYRFVLAKMGSAVSGRTFTVRHALKHGNRIPTKACCLTEHETVTTDLLLYYNLSKKDKPPSNFSLVALARDELNARRFFTFETCVWEICNLGADKVKALSVEPFALAWEPCSAGLSARSAAEKETGKKPFFCDVRTRVARIFLLCFSGTAAT